MSFIRPEVLSALKRWREAIIAGVILLGSLQAASATTGLMNAFAWVTALIGAALFIEGVRRARLPQETGGVGVVDVDERQITYFGPHGGGALSINELSRIKVRTTADGPASSDFFWEFTDKAGQRLTIPGDAENASALFDALTALPGADYEAVIKASGSMEAQEFLVWERTPALRIDT
ncbi:MAG: hypothetical protein AAFX07_15315 [Pseudomonadota bacterium]